MERTREIKKGSPLWHSAINQVEKGYYHWFLGKQWRIVGAYEHDNDTFKLVLSDQLEG